MRHGNIAVRVHRRILESSREIDAGRHLRQGPGAGVLDGMPGSHTERVVPSRLSTIIS